MIHSATDTAAIAPLIAAFEARYPQIDVLYTEYNTAELYRAFRRQFERNEPTADIVISSAMDLQTKLVNDGYAQKYASPYTAALPAWANWRNEAFGFTFEPVVMAYNKAAFSPASGAPQSCRTGAADARGARVLPQPGRHL